MATISVWDCRGRAHISSQTEHAIVVVWLDVLAAISGHIETIAN